MDDFRNGKFLVGSNVRTDEQRRATSEILRNQNENQRMMAENSRNQTAANALGIAQVHSKSNFLTQIGLFTAVVLTIIILATIAILAYQKATDNQSLVDLNNIRDLKLSNLDVLDTTDLKTLTVTGDTSAKDTTITGDLNVTGHIDFGSSMVIDDGISIGGGLSVGTTSNLYGDVWAREGVSVDGSLKVGTTSNLYGDVWAREGVSVDGGMSVGSKLNLYGDVWAREGVSVDGGMSVGSKLNLYGDVWAREGVSVDGGMSVGSKLNLYGDVWAREGVSVDGGLSVGTLADINQAKIKKDMVISTKTLEGISTGYQLTSSDAGNTYIIQNEDNSGLSIKNRFELPQLSGSDDNGLKYHFLWDLNSSDNTKNFHLHTYDQNNRLYGTVLTAENGSSVYTMAANQDTGSNHGLSTPMLFHYDGTVFPGSKLDCTYMDGNWLLRGQLGTSSDNSQNNGFIGTLNPDWIIAGASTNNPNQEELLISSTGSYFYEANSNLDIECQGMAYGNNIWVATGFDSSYNGVSLRYSNDGISWNLGTGIDNLVGFTVAYGTSSNGTSIWVAGGSIGISGAIIYSLDGISWQSSTGAGFKGDYEVAKAVAYGTSSDGTSIWVATGYDTSGNNILYSLDGISWDIGTGANFDVNGSGNAVAYGTSSNGTGIWVATGYEANGNNILYSLDGISWDIGTGANFGTAGSGRAVAYGLTDGGVSIWSAGGDTTGDNKLLYSLDGISWDYSSGDNFGQDMITDIAYGKDSEGNARWVAVGTGDIMLYSSDAQTWTQINNGDLTSGQTVTFNQPLYPNEGNPVEN